MRKIIFLFLSIIAFNSAEAQTVVTGTVTNEKNERLPFVSVGIKNLSRGVKTDFDGNYRLEVRNASDTVVFFFIG
ncbi:MAG: carboxypeptidase-like regulatory domain-containing protein, partial [Flavobacteriales bacterium]